MSATPALRALAALGVEVTLHPYACDPKAAATGLQAAQALGIDPAVMLKTLMVEVDGRPGCCVVPSDRQLSMKRVAAAFGGKSAAMLPVARAERLSGYHVGGISPFGQKRAVPTVFEATACTAPRVWINAGQRGLILSLPPEAALAALGARACPLIA
ncbi:MAG: aminoacyl-tRNA deacylase [Tabrizicola sp.]